MASEDVIELGSSDEETAEPAPKRKKPQLNAMVHIPGKLPVGLIVTPPKSANKPRINPASILRGSAVTVTKVTKNNVNSIANVKMLNGNTAKGSVGGKSGPSMKRNFRMPIQSTILSGVKVMNSTSMSGPNPLINMGSKPSIRGAPKKIGVKNLNVGILKPQLIQGNVPANVIKLPLNNTELPPGLTIKRTGPPLKTGLKVRTNIRNINPLAKAMNMLKPGTLIHTKSRGVYGLSQACSTDVPTVELDDDEPTTSGRQWYMRPEDEKKEVTEEHHNPLEDKTSKNNTDESSNAGQEQSVEESQNNVTEKSPSASVLEKQNNKEPDKSKYIEITIDDSPIKAIQNKKCYQVGAELPITIEDSPIRNKTGRTVQSCKSDDEQDNSPKDRNSKKKLEYQKKVEDMEVVEIEFEPIPVEKTEISEINKAEVKLNPTQESPRKEKQSVSPKEAVSAKADTVKESSCKKREQPNAVLACVDIVEIEESPIKPLEEVNPTTPKKNTPSKPAYRMKDTQPIEIIDIDDQEKNEFNPIYQSFIKLCFKLENSDDMKKIVEKKIKAYYKQVPKEYTDSENFTDMVATKIVAMKAAPEKMYLYIKDVVDELNLQRKLNKAQPAKEKNKEQENFLYGEDSEFDAKRQRQIRKLEKTLKKLHRAIQKLEEQEVDFDDEEDSVYLLTERYKERSVRVHAKLCQLTNTKMPSEARVQIDALPGHPKGPAKRLEKWINRKVPIGTPMPFPDFHDVLRCVREANQEDKIGWNEADIMEEARSLFVRCGKKLQRRRQENEWRLAASRVPADVPDPAENSEDLKRKLQENRRLAAKKETEVFNKYADRQNQLHLEAVEIGDKEAEESPVESDDEVEEEVVSDTDPATDKQKRKERIKRLLEKTKVSEPNSQKPDQLPADGDNSKGDASQQLDVAEISTKTVEEGDTKNTEEPTLSQKDPSSSKLLNKDSKESDLDSKSHNKDEEIGSDIDELHLLQRRYSVSNNTSSDTGSGIAIDDTSSSGEKSSDERGLKKQSSDDVISIENSSYSESERKNDYISEDTEKDIVETRKMVNETLDNNMELECSVDVAEKTSDIINDKDRNGCLEDILLASSDEDDKVETSANKNAEKVHETCINLRDDSISIGETMIVENADIDGSGEDSKPGNSDINTITDGSSVEGIEFGPMNVNSNDQERLESIAETECEKSADEEIANETTSMKSPVDNEERSPVESTNVESISSPEDGTIDETICINSVESIDDGLSNETETHTIQSIDPDNTVPNVESPETMEQDTIIQNDGDTVTKDIQELITTENTDQNTIHNSDTSNENTIAVPEAMEVDS